MTRSVSTGLNNTANTIFPDSLEMYIRAFQQTGSSEEFLKVLFLIERLILRMIHQERRKSYSLRRLDLEDLYQIGVISLYEALAKFRIELSSIYSLPRYLQGYLKKNLWKYAKAENRYICCGLQIGRFVRSNTCYQAADKQREHRQREWLIEDALRRLREGKGLSAEDEAMLKMRYEDGLKYKEIAEKAGRSEECVKKRVLRIRAKIKGILKELSRDDGGSLFIKQKAVAF